MRPNHWTESGFVEPVWSLWKFMKVHETADSRWRQTRINCTGLNELRQDNCQFCLEYWRYPISWKKEPFFSLARIYNNFIDYNFISRDEIFIFSPGLILPEFRNSYWILLLSWQKNRFHGFYENWFSLSTECNWKHWLHN